jgi:hypothetical protein
VGSAGVLPPHGRPALLGHPVAGLCIQHGVAAAAPDHRVVLRLRCNFPHDTFQQSFTLFFPRYPTPSIPVSNGSLLFVVGTGSTELPHSLFLNNILVSPQIIKNLISIRQFTIDNNCSVEFDPTGCSVKDLQTRNVIVMCNSSGALYPMRLPPTQSFVAKAASPLWHRRLGHPDHEALSQLASSGSFT